VLNYEKGERKLKIEISNRGNDDHYEVKAFMGINMLVMTIADMFANKLCALLNRSELTNRDIFDCWFFMENRTPINQYIVESRMGMPLSNYLQKCIDTLNDHSDSSILNGIGDLIDEKTKNFVRSKLLAETMMLMRFYQQFPITQ
jgi:predicted nucleotidyltransferase component of viral defense system